MTFLRGTTTVGQLPQKLAQLICGEVADDTAVTNAAGDRWVREFTRTVTDAVTNSTTTLTSATAAFTAADYGSSVIAAGVPLGTTIASVTNATTVVLSAAATASASGVTAQIALDTIRTPSAKDVNTGSISNRAGYFTLLGTATQTPPMGVAQSSVCKVTNPFTSDPSTSGFHRWIVWIYVAFANTTPGNYSTAQLRWSAYDADSNALIQNGTAPITPNAAGLTTVSSGLTITVSDPSGTLPLNTYWVRAFSATYMYGIDWWPMLYRAAAAPTFSVAPPGVAGTDYDVLSTHAPPPRDYTSSATPYQGTMERSSLFNGLAIKTATGLGASPLYTLSFPMALAKGRIFAPNNGSLSLDVGQARVDPVNPGSAVRNVGGLRQTLWMQFAVTAASMTAATQVQYWLSVKSDGIVLVVNADPGGTGKMGIAYWGTLVNPGNPTYDVFPIVHSYRAADYGSTDVSIPDWGIAAQYNYWSLQRRQDSSEGTRDWQTKWMRGEGNFAFNNTSWAMYAGSCTPDQTGGTSTYGTFVGTSAQLLLTYLTTFPWRQNKPAQDGKWWMYPVTFTELGWGSASTNSNENYVIRGSLARVLFLPGDQWANGDELTDTVSGTKYLCVMPDYIGVLARGRIAANSYVGGPAVVEA